jgi:AcrR family transcriptional regulator
VEDIARQANVTTGAMYHHFGGKSDLYVALVEANSTKANKLAEQIVQEGGTPETMIRRLLIRQFEFIEEDKEYRAVVELSLNTTDFSPELADIKRKILKSRRLLAHFFSKLIQQGIEAGEFRPNASSEDAALALVGFMNGIGLIWVQDPDQFSIKGRAEGLIDTFLKGIRLHK